MHVYFLFPMQNSRNTKTTTIGMKELSKEHLDNLFEYIFRFQ